MSCKTVNLLLPGYTVHSPVASDNLAPTDMESSAGLTAFNFTDEYNREPWQSQFADILGLDTGKGKHLPTARLALDNQFADTSVVRADPIFLKADRDSARLITAEQLALTDADADTFLDSLNEFVAPDGLTFFKRNATQWYMSGMPAELLESYPPSFLANRNASSFLLTGESMASWRRLMTELQMLLHSHPLNQQRETEGMMPVNSIWFWGGGSLPAMQLSRPDVTVYANHEQAVDMARYHDIHCHPLSHLVGSRLKELDTTDTIILDTRVVDAWLEGDGAKLEQSLAYINSQWLAPLIEEVRAGKLVEVNILTEDGLRGKCDAQSLREMPSTHRHDWLQTVVNFFRR